MPTGSRITLRPAQPDDRRAVYEWLACSDLTTSMAGPPLFPDTPIPTWDKFCADYVPLFFDGSQPEFGRSYIIEVQGEAVGHVSYSQVDTGASLAELDIWLKSEAHCGRGYGADALRTLMRHLHETLGLSTFVMRPSARNPRAIAAYARAGFVSVPMSQEEQLAKYGPMDQEDSVVMCMKLL